MIMSHLFNCCDEEDGQAELRDDFSNREVALRPLVADRTFPGLQRPRQYLPRNNGDCASRILFSYPSSADCAVTDSAAVGDRRSKLFPAALVIASGLFYLLKAN